MNDLDSLRRDFKDWTIGQVADLSAWTAERHPTEHSLHVIVAHSVDQLRDKLTEADAE